MALLSSSTEKTGDPQRWDVGAISQKTASTLKNAGKYEVEIIEGAHAGTVLSLEPGSVSIGSSKDNTIILFADDVADKHLEIELPRGVMSDIRVTPVQEAVYLEDGTIVEIGQQAHIPAGELIDLGDAKLIVSRVADPRSFVKPGIRLMAILCLVAMIPMVYGVFSSMAVSVADASSSAISVIQTGISNQREKYLGVPATSDKGQLEAFSWTARTKLEDLKLNHRLRITPTATGSLRVYGNISDQELPRWTSFLQWYDSNPGFPSLVRDVNRADVDRDLPNINSVWMDAQPTVVFSDGTIATVGSQLKDGWKVVTISNQNVTLERDGAYVSLTY